MAEPDEGFENDRSEDKTGLDREDPAGEGNDGGEPSRGAADDRPMEDEGNGRAEDFQEDTGDRAADEREEAGNQDVGDREAEERQAEQPQRGEDIREADGPGEREPDALDRELAANEAAEDVGLEEEGFLGNEGGGSPNQSNGFKPKSPGNRSSPALGSYADLKAKTAFAGSTVDGVLKRTTYMTQLSSYRAGPKITLASRGQNMFIRSSSTPAPGTYNLPPDEKSKFKKPPSFSFGGNSRFGLGESPTKKMPGPGAYNPIDPSITTDTKVGFGTAARGRGALVAQANPGPGAYEQKGFGTTGPMFTAAGRHPTSYMRARSLPGPGAYNPNSSMQYKTPAKCGFGTSTRDDTGGRARNLVQPGPGTYEMQNFKATGSDAPKFSATSRRRIHDLNSYVTPGPGAYNAHVTQFGY